MQRRALKIGVVPGTPGPPVCPLMFNVVSEMSSEESNGAGTELYELQLYDLVFRTLRTLNLHGTVVGAPAPDHCPCHCACPTALRTLLLILIEIDRIEVITNPRFKLRFLIPMSHDTSMNADEIERIRRCALRLVAVPR